MTEKLLGYRGQIDIFLIFVYLVLLIFTNIAKKLEDDLRETTDFLSKN
jgi:hypothetical protein